MEFDISYTNQEITPWGGMVLLKQMMRKIGFKNVISECASLPQPGSNRGYSPTAIIESFLVSIWCGANRFLHTEITRHDEALKKIFGWSKAPAQDVYKRYFAKFDQVTNQEVGDYFLSWIFDNTRFNNYTLDCDSSVLTRYGKQQGAKKGYNPHKPGRVSHHPIMAFVADVKLVANLWLRSGNTSSSESFVPFLEDTFVKLKNKNISLLRLDSGFYSKEVFDYLEQKEKPINYIVAVRFYEPIQRIIAGNQAWMQVDEGIEISEMQYQSPQWTKSRRMIVVRQRIKDRPKASGRTLRLFKEEEYYRQYRYTAYITNLTLSASDVWRLYRGRADSENRIKELKYDFGFDSFNMQSFWGTEAALLFSMIAYDLMALFRQFILNSKVQHTLSTLRYQTFAIGAYFQKHKDKYILKLSLNMKRREWFTGLWNQSNQIILPFVFSNA
jgi:Transposase DDE domain group 1